MSNFGMDWGPVQTPLQTRVAVIDPELQPQIGLTAMQLDNLKLERKGPPPPKEALVTLVQDNVDGLPGPIEYSSITVRGAVEVELKVYNAFGKLSIKNGVRISRGAANKLGVKVGDTITIL